MTEGPDGFHFISQGTNNSSDLDQEKGIKRGKLVKFGANKKYKKLNGTEEQKQNKKKIILCFNICHLKAVICCVLLISMWDPVVPSIMQSQKCSNLTNSGFKVIKLTLCLVLLF